MPVETFGYVDSLNVNNPIPSEGLVGGDDHIRGIKATLKNTFPQISGAITATHTQINTTVQAVAVDGVGVLADAGVFFKTSGDGFKNTLAGDIDVWLGGQIGATFQRTGGANFFKLTGTAQITGTVEATTLKGAGAWPIGMVGIWPSDTLPPSSDGVFTWCNGAEVGRVAYPIAFERLGTRYGAGNGSTTFNVPNYQEVTLVGKSGMGGATAPGRLASIAAGIKTVLGAVFGADVVALTVAQIASHFHTVGIFDPGHSHTYVGSAVNISGAANSSSYGTITTQSTGSSTTGVRCTSANGLDTTNSNGLGEAHTNLQPSAMVNFIIRLA